MALPVILDTDIGGDVDDLLALAFLLASPEIDLLAVTCVYGDVLTRARIALKTLALTGRSGILVAAGAARALNPERPLLCGQDDGQGLLTAADVGLHPIDAHAAEFIVDAVMRRPGEIHLVSIGPLTNLALAFSKEPRVADNVVGITVMGGAVGGADRLDLPWVDYNFACDPEAASIVLASGAPVSLVPLDVTVEVRIDSEDVAGLRAAGGAHHLALAEQVQRYPRYQQFGSTYLHDPLATATLVRPDLVAWTPVHVQVETGGEYSAGKLIAAAPSLAAPPNARIALRVDAAAAHAEIVGRLLKLRGV
jgi:purine nucleosidase